MEYQQPDLWLRVNSEELLPLCRNYSLENDTENCIIVVKRPLGTKMMMIRVGLSEVLRSWEINYTLSQGFCEKRYVCSLIWTPKSRSGTRSDPTLKWPGRLYLALVEEWNASEQHHESTEKETLLSNCRTKWWRYYWHGLSLLFDDICIIVLIFWVLNIKLMKSILLSYSLLVISKKTFAYFTKIQTKQLKHSWVPNLLWVVY